MGWGGVFRGCADHGKIRMFRCPLSRPLTPQAYELRRLFQRHQRIAGAGVEPLLRSLQQLAALADRSGSPADALRYLEPLIAALKERGGAGAPRAAAAAASAANGADFSAVAAAAGPAAAAVQRATRHAVRLAFRSLPLVQRATLQQAVAVAHPSAAGGAAAGAGAGGSEHSPAAVTFVVSRLFDHPGGPGAYVRLVAGQVLSAAAAGASLFTFAAMSAVPGQPSLLDQLAVLASLLAEPGVGAGADLTADAGCSTTSALGARSAVGAALRPASSVAGSGVSDEESLLRMSLLTPVVVPAGRVGTTMLTLAGEGVSYTPVSVMALPCVAGVEL